MICSSISIHSMTRGLTDVRWFVQDLVNDFNCACLPGFTGALCEVEINECASNPCQHGATCHDTQAAFQCQCAPGYTGLLCQVSVLPLAQRSLN